MSKKQKMIVLLNLFTVAVQIYASTICIINRGWYAFQYYTMDSNIFAAITSIMLIFSLLSARTFFGQAFTQSEQPLQLSDLNVNLAIITHSLKLTYFSLKGQGQYIWNLAFQHIRNTAVDRCILDWQSCGF